MLRYVTTNEGKVLEAREYLDGVAAVEPAHYDYVEVQADDLETIARRGARDAHRALGEPVLVDDSGLFVAALDGFPGPYSSYVEDTLGIERVQRLVAPEDSHRAQFRCTLAYAEGPEGPAGLADRPGTAVSGEAAAGEAAGRTGGPDGDAPGEDSGTAGDAVFVETFTGTVEGTVVEPRGEGGFGYDPIFAVDGTTFAEMPTERKNAHSHRGRALAAFADWFAERGT